MQPAAEGVVELLAQQESEQRLAREPAVRRWLSRVRWAGSVAVAGFGLGGLVLSLAFGKGRGEPVFAVLAIMVAVMFGIPGALVMVRALASHWRRSAARPHPSRWKFASPRGVATPVARGAVDCSAPLLAPLSGRPCAGFELGIRSDGNAKGDAGSWLLLEQRVAACSVDGRALEPGQVHLSLLRQAVCVDTTDLRTRNGLRDRGFSASVSGRRVFETIVPLGAVVSVSTTKGADVLRVV